MRDGFVRVAVATPVIRVADTAFNMGSAIRLMREAAGAGAKILTLPEYCLTGYTARGPLSAARCAKGAGGLEGRGRGSQAST